MPYTMYGSSQLRFQKLFYRKISVLYVQCAAITAFSCGINSDLTKQTQIQRPIGVQRRTALAFTVQSRTQTIYFQGRTAAERTNYELYEQ